MENGGREIMAELENPLKLKIYVVGSLSSCIYIKFDSNPWIKLTWIAVFNYLINHRLLIFYFSSFPTSLMLK